MNNSITRLGTAAAAVALLGVSVASAADDFGVERVSTAERSALGNVASGITGLGDNIWDAAAGGIGVIFEVAGGATLLASDVVGFVDDNHYTRDVTDGIISNHGAEFGLYLTRLGNDMVEISHGLDLGGYPTLRESYLSQTDDDEIDYIHFEDGWGCILAAPGEVMALALGDLYIRPSGNILRLFSVDQSDDFERDGLNYIENHLCHTDRDDSVIVEVPVVERMEVPVETEVIREVFRTVRRETFTLRDVIFELDSAALTPQGAGAVGRVAEQLQGKDVISLEVVGHTCDRGSDEYNLNLAQRRADTVVAALKAQGLADVEISAFSEGEASPLVPNVDEAHRAINRRVEITAVIDTEED